MSFEVIFSITYIAAGAQNEYEAASPPEGTVSLLDTQKNSKTLIMSAHMSLEHTFCI